MQKDMYAPLDSGERNKVVMSLLQLGGPDTFLVAMDKELGSEENPEPVSGMWDLGHNLHPTATKHDLLACLVGTMHTYPRWSRLALARALSASYRTPLANEIWPSWRQGDPRLVSSAVASSALIPTEIRLPSAPSLQDLAEVPPQLGWQHFVPPSEQEAAAVPVPAVAADRTAVLFDPDLEPLSFGERLVNAHVLLNKGSVLPFFLLANESFRTPGHPNPISAMYEEIASRRSCAREVDVLHELLGRMCGLERWSRKRFESTLEAFLSGQ